MGTYFVINFIRATSIEYVLYLIRLFHFWIIVDVDLRERERERKKEGGEEKSKTHEKERRKAARVLSLIRNALHVSTCLFLPPNLPFFRIRLIFHFADPETRLSWSIDQPSLSFLRDPKKKNSNLEGLGPPSVETTGRNLLNSFSIHLQICIRFIDEGRKI